MAAGIVMPVCCQVLVRHPLMLGVHNQRWHLWLVVNIRECILGMGMLQ